MPANLKTLKDQASYAIGLNIGQSMKGQGVDVNPDLVAQGIRDILTGAKPALNDQQIQEVMTAFAQQAQAAAEARAKVEGEKNQKDADAFLAANKAKEGVKTLPSGLQYRVLKAGTGRKPTATDTVTTHYTGKLLNGEVFDSSVARGEPASFPVNRVIPGWTEALQLMPVGSKWELFIPANLAYGPQGQPGAIPPNAMLVFEVELLDIKGAALPKLQPN
jgi:FKBP-type peptidyl-prolyl cis-trans isomerase FklB